MYVPDDNALLAFDTYFAETGTLQIIIEAGDVQRQAERYTCSVEIKGGGKWKRIILRAGDFKAEHTGMPLLNFSDGRALVFDCEREEQEFAIANVLWL